MNLTDEQITKNRIIFASLGLAAPIIQAYDLIKMGYKCIDIGNITSVYKFLMNKMPVADNLRNSDEFVDGVTEIRKFIRNRSSEKI